MTTSSSYSFDLNRNAIIKTAARQAGIIGPGVEPSANDLNTLSDLLNVEVKALQAEGVILSTIERVTATLTAGTATVSVAADTIDVDGSGFVTPTGASAGTSNTIVFPMTRAEYMALSDPATQGVPTRFYLEKLNTLTVYLYPVPDANTASFTYARVRLLKDMDTGSVTLDLPSRWLKSVISRLAHQAALTYQKPLDRVQYLKAESEQQMSMAMGQDAERGDAWFHVGRY